MVESTTLDIHSSIAKQILEDNEKSQAKKISFTPNAEEVSYGGEANAENYLEKILAVIK